MQLLYLDDSGKVHPNDSAMVAVFAGFSVDEGRWHSLIRQISGAKAHWLPARGKPHEWEIKSADFLTTNNWLRAKKRHFCFELTNILQRNGCRVFSISLEKSKVKDPLLEEKFVPIMLCRLISKFNDCLETTDTTGSVVMDWSTYQLDHHITQCVTAMTVASAMDRLRGGVTYGSSAALPPLQVADIIASALRRDAEGQPHVSEFAERLRELQYSRPDAYDDYGNVMCGVGKVC